MRRINIYIDDDLDRRAANEAKRRRISKAELIRKSPLATLGPATPADAIDRLVGMSDAEPADVDAVIYGP